LDGIAALNTARRQQQREAQALAQKLQADELAARAAELDPPRLMPALRKPVTLDFREAPLRTVFEALSRSTGLNFVFDREVKADTRVTLTIANTTIEDVIAIVAVTNQLEHKVLNANTVLLYPATPAKQRDYVDLDVRTFYLANAEAKSVFAMLKTVLKTRDLHADEKLNSLTMRDTPQAIRLAEKLIAAQDLAEPEVTLDVEVLEVKRSRLTEIGIEPPGKFSVLNIVPNPSTVVSSATGATTVVNNTLTTTQLTLDKLRGITGSSVGIDSPALNFRSEVGDTNILANPRIRVKNHEKARVLIGDRVPVITTTTTANVGVSESVSYLDVGLKLDVEPTVFLDNEVGVKVALEVSNVVREVRGRTGSLTYQIGTRLATTQLRLRDGETQALAGLISDEDRHTTVGAPGATDLPILGRLFSSERNDRSKTEIVLLITPRVVRNLSGVTQMRAEYPGGTEAAVGVPALRLRAGGGISQLPPSSGAPGAAATPAPSPPPPPEPAPVPEPGPTAAPASAPVAAPASAPVAAPAPAPVTVPGARPAGEPFSKP
jgi:general secretion pathway protein D